MAHSVTMLGSTGSTGRSKMGVMAAQWTRYNFEADARRRAPWRDSSVTHAQHNEVRLFMDLPRLDLAAIGRLMFEKPEEARFPCSTLAKDALGAEGALPPILNAANEIAGGAYMAEKIEFYTISEIVEGLCSTFTKGGQVSATDTDTLAIDCEACIQARSARFRKAHVRRS